MNIQNNQRKPFKNPSIAMKHGVFSNIPEKTNFSEKDKLFLKYAQKTIFPQKYYKFVDFGFGWYLMFGLVFPNGTKFLNSGLQTLLNLPK